MCEPARLVAHWAARARRGRARARHPRAVRLRRQREPTDGDAADRAAAAARAADADDRQLPLRLHGAGARGVQAACAAPRIGYAGSARAAEGAAQLVSVAVGVML